MVLPICAWVEFLLLEHGKSPSGHALKKGKNCCCPTVVTCQELLGWSGTWEVPPPPFLAGFFLYRSCAGNPEDSKHPTALLHLPTLPFFPLCLSERSLSLGGVEAGWSSSPILGFGLNVYFLCNSALTATRSKKKFLWPELRTAQVYKHKDNI